MPPLDANPSSHPQSLPLPLADSLDLIYARHSHQGSCPTVFEYLLRRYEPSPQEVLEILELHQLSFEFRQEQHYRESFEAYCEEYYRVAEQHKREYAAMQNEPDIFAMFWRRRGRS